MKIFDVSLPLHDRMVAYPGDPGFSQEYVRRIAGGAGSNNSRVSVGSHTGTHLDAPLHFINGAATLEELPLEALVGPARVFALEVTEKITAADLAPLDWEGVRRVLFRTRNSELWSGEGFVPEFIYLTGDAAEFLVGRQIVLVGVDCLSVDQFRAPGHPAHHALLGAGVAALEGLNLSEAPPGDYLLVCAPLRVLGAEAAPARVFLLQGV